MAPEIEHLIKSFAALPGLGERSARRVVLFLLAQKQSRLEPISAAINNVISKISKCSVCGNIDTTSPMCSICCDNNRDKDCLCIVEQVCDLWAIERTKSFEGQYFVLGGTLSAIDGIGPSELRVDDLVELCKVNKYKEIIIALSATLNGQTTAHYLKESLEGKALKITEIARGVPLGGELDYLDDGTLITALSSRT